MNISYLIDDAISVSLILAYIGIGISSLAFIICLIIICVRYPANWGTPSLCAFVFMIILIVCATIVSYDDS